MRKSKRRPVVRPTLVNLNGIYVEVSPKYASIVSTKCVIKYFKKSFYIKLEDYIINMISNDSRIDVGMRLDNNLYALYFKQLTIADLVIIAEQFEVYPTFKAANDTIAVSLNINVEEFNN